MTAYDILTRFRKSTKQVLRRVKGLELPYIHEPQYDEKYLVVREGFPISTERKSFREPGTNGNHASVGQSRNGSFSDNNLEIPVSMENVRLGGTEY